jgi:hypothetical protein
MQLQFKFGLSRKIQLKEINLKNIAKHLKNIPNFNTGFRYCRRAPQKKRVKKQKKYFAERRGGHSTESGCRVPGHDKEK